MNWDNLHHIEIAHLATKAVSYNITSQTKLTLEKTSHFDTGRKDMGRFVILIKSSAQYYDSKVLKVSLHA